jgi:hypothetical protein
VGAWIEVEFGIVYDSRSGLVKRLHWLGMQHHRPQEIARKLDPAKQVAFIAFYAALLKQMQADDVVLFGDAVHPLHEVRPVGCWAPAGTALAVQQTSDRDRPNVHGAIDLETGRTYMLESASVDAISTIRLHFIPTYCPHLNPIERLWDEMHKNVTHNRCHERFADFKDAALTFLNTNVPKNWCTLCDKVSDNFRVITPKDFRVIA